MFQSVYKRLGPPRSIQKNSNDLYRVSKLKTHTKRKKKHHHHRCSSVVSDAAEAKGNLLSLFTACECVEPLLYIMSALIHGHALGASAQGSEFPPKKWKRAGVTESEQAVTQTNMKTEGEERREERDCGSQTWAPTLFLLLALFPIIPLGITLPPSRLCLGSVK